MRNDEIEYDCEDDMIEKCGAPMRAVIVVTLFLAGVTICILYGWLAYVYLQM